MLQASQPAGKHILSAEMVLVCATAAAAETNIGCKPASKHRVRRRAGLIMLAKLHSGSAEEADLLHVKHVSLSWSVGEEASLACCSISRGNGGQQGGCRMLHAA